VQEADRSVTFFDSTFAEALALTHESRDYLASRQWRERGAKSATDKLLSSCESLRLTARLTQVMAWLLVQRAVHAGELSREESRAERYRLSGQKVCAEGDATLAGDLDPRLRELLDKSHQLYRRVQRLDAMQDKGDRPGPPRLPDFE
jgi:regulator of CtrA degradation